MFNNQSKQCLCVVSVNLYTIFIDVILYFIHFNFMTQNLLNNLVQFVQILDSWAVPISNINHSTLSEIGTLKCPDFRHSLYPFHLCSILVVASQQCTSNQIFQQLKKIKQNYKKHRLTKIYALKYNFSNSPFTKTIFYSKTIIFLRIIYNKII